MDETAESSAPTDVLAAPETTSGFLADNWIWLALIGLAVVGGVVAFVLMRIKAKRNAGAPPEDVKKVAARMLGFWAFLSFASLGLMAAVIVLLYLEQQYYIGDPRDPDPKQHKSVWPDSTEKKAY